MPSATVQDGTSLRSVPAAVDVCPLCFNPRTPGQDHVCPEPQPAGQMTTGVLAANVAMLMAPLSYGLGSKEQIQQELDGIAAAVRTFPMKQPDQVMRECAAYTARLTELEVLLHRVESLDRQYVKIRTMQVDKWLSQLEFQFKVASRLIEVMRQDIALSGAQI